MGDNQLSHPIGGRKRQPRGGRVLGLLAAVWLNLALAPCTMAMETGDDQHDDHKCPHCPPSQGQGHHEMHGGMQAEASCADGLSDCGLDEAFSHEARGCQLQLKDAQYELPAAAVANDFAARHAVCERQRAPPPTAAAVHAAGPPIHLLNCVFLD
jgi:hypothetical protein